MSIYIRDTIGITHFEEEKHLATATKRGGSYLLRVYAGYNTDGKQIEKSKTWKPPAGMTDKQADKEAKHQAALFEEAVRNGIDANGNVKFADFAELWFSRYAEKQLRPKTLEGYRKLLVKINRGIGHIPLNKIRPPHLLEFYESIAEETPGNASFRCTINIKAQLKQRGLTKTAFSKMENISLTTLDTAAIGKPISKVSAQKICTGLEVALDTAFHPTNPSKKISASTIHHYHRLISDILNCAVNWQYIPYNPCLRISPPKKAATEIAYLDDAQARHLLDLLRQENSIYRRAVTMLLLTGLRRGELFGLEWQDVDFTNKTLNICRTSQYLPQRGVYTDLPKNKTSHRLIMVSDQVIALLREQQAWQWLQTNTLKAQWQCSNRIFTTENGTPMRPDRLTQWFSKFIARTDLPPIHIHSLRHTYATLCIAQGVPITAVAAQLGHANVATTATIYAHAIKSAQIVAANKIGNLFENVKITTKSE